MARDHTSITRPQLLTRVRQTSGRRAERAARDLLDLATGIGAKPIASHCAISIRLPVPEMDYSGWLTLYLVSEAGTMYVNWLERWADAGASPSLAGDYEDGLRAILGVKQVKFNPSSYERAVPLDLVAAKMPALREFISSTAAKLDSQVRSRPTNRRVPDDVFEERGRIAALERALSKGQPPGTRRTRSSKPRSS